MKVEVEIIETEMENDNGIMVDSVVATCMRCDNETDSFGTGEMSRRRCLALMRETCPEGESNFYVDADE